MIHRPKIGVPVLPPLRSLVAFALCTFALATHARAQPLTWSARAPGSAPDIAATVNAVNRESGRRASAGHGARARGHRQLTYQAIAQGIEEQLEAAGVPGGALAIVEGSQLRFATGLGVKEAGGSESVDADTRFRIGSITKTFTSALAVQLAAERVVSLDAPITRYVPELRLQPPHDPSRITLRMLLSHTAGVADYVEWECATDEEALSRWFSEHPNVTLWTPPGRLFSYSNLGYSLAGLVLERAAGAPYRQLADELIFEPLALTSMTYDVAEAQAGNHARGFSPGFELEPADMACALTDPPGFLWSSARDLARFAATLLRGGDRVLDRRGLRQMQTPHTPTDPSAESSYGLGLAQSIVRGERAVWHNGGMPGYLSSMWLVPARELAVVLLINGNSVNTDALVTEAIGELLDLPEQPPVDRTTPPSAWVDYLGIYEEQQSPSAFPEPWLGTVYVELEGEQLIARDAENTERFPLEQIAGDVWLAHVEDDFVVPITFWRDRHGRVEYIATRDGALRRIGELP